MITANLLIQKVLSMENNTEPQLSEDFTFADIEDYVREPSNGFSTVKFLGVAPDNDEV